jgi:hypothetical protein
MKLVTVLQSESVVTSPLTDLSILGLPETWQRRIAQIINDNRMLYEPWIETAADFNELRERLKGRGFTDIQSGATPLLDFKAYKQAPVAETSSCKVSRTMLRKKM